uniref:Fatty-acid and retinol-binding protein 1 n=2 Tax=Steinernema glaseri TaxID=37863 RepID=A0A1I8A2Z9_9BILA
MTLLTLSLVALCYSSVLSLSIPQEKDAKQFLEMLPEDIQNFYKSLTDDDVKALNAMDSEVEGKDEDEAQALMEKEHPELAKKLDIMISGLTAKIDSLSAEPKKFMTEVFDKLIPNNGVDEAEYQRGIDQVLNDADRLSQSAVDEILKVFPTLKTAFKD